jgi:tRNA A37 threonylcarbamoyladenosine dehydratase
MIHLGLSINSYCLKKNIGEKMFYKRNLGLVTDIEQQKIINSTVLIAGVGGMGGVAAEVLVRMGVGKIILCDHDIFEEVNFNRQIHSNIKTKGLKKVNVLKDEFLNINPNLIIQTYEEGVTLENISQLIQGVDVIINGMDQMYFSLILERNARKKNITIIDAWLTPFASVFVITPTSPHWEDFLDLPTKNIPLEKINEKLCKEAVKKEIEFTFSHFNPYAYVSQELVKDVALNKRPRPSLAPVVWLSGVLMANEAFKWIIGHQVTDFAGIFYNQYSHEVICGKINDKHTKNKKVA